MRQRNKVPWRLNVIHTHSGDWSLSRVVCRASSGWVRVASGILVTWIASVNSYMINKQLMLYISHSQTFLSLTLRNKCK